MLENLKTNLSLFVCIFLLSFNLNANEWTTGTNSLLDLTNQTGTTQHNLGDDARSGAVNIGFDFNFYGNTYTQGYISTNGCFSFTTSYCNDYTPDPLPDTSYTIYPFWTDLIRDNNSKILSKSFEDYFVVGWYDLREYNRASDNTFEMLLYETNSAIEFRYGDLDIINHDVLIGVQGSSSQYSQYIFHDECGVGTTNGSNCVNQNWNATNYNTAIENKSIYYSDQCTTNPLSSTECAGYNSAYLLQQCGLNSLYDNSCVGYWQAFDDQQCALNPQYGPFCPGYTTQQSVAYFIEDEFDYGYVEEFDYGYVAEEYFFAEEEFMFVENFETFEIFEEELFDYPEEMFYTIEEEPFYEELERMILLEEEFNEDPIENFLEFETIEELDEWFEEEMAEEEDEETEEELIEDETKEDKGSKRAMQLRVVANTIKTATQSVSGTISGSSIHSTGNTTASGGTTGSTNFSSSPSMSTQLVSSVAQTQQILTMSSNVNTGSQVSSSMGTNTAVINTSSSQETQAMAQNIKQQQEEIEEQQEETGEYGDDSQLISYMGYVPGFTAYANAQLPPQPTWYEPKDIYANVAIKDNITAFYGLASQSINTLTNLKTLQPNL